MPAPATGDEFIALTRKSRVVESARLNTYLQKLGPLPDAKTLSDRLLSDGLLTGFQAEQLMLGRWKRFFIGKYKVLERLGRGGMATVFLCEHELMRRRVAIKVLPTAHGRDSSGSALERFVREARAIAAVDHPNLVRAYDIDQDENLYFLVMEYVDGVNLFDLVRRSGPLSVEQAAHSIAGAATGLQHAHEMGLVHRDIKPANILVDRAGAVKVLDLGLALFCRADDDEQLTKKSNDTAFGTADYLAPEQALNGHAVDIRADIYALGGTLYFLLTGWPPFPEAGVAQKLVAHQEREPVPLRTRRPDAPAGLVGVFERMVKKDPAARFQTPAEVVAALAPWTANPVEPPPEQRLPRFGPASMGFAATVSPAKSDASLASLPPTPPNPATDLWGTIAAGASPGPAVPPDTRATRKPRAGRSDSGRKVGVLLGVGALTAVLIGLGIWVTRNSANPPPPQPQRASKAR